MRQKKSDALLFQESAVNFNYDKNLSEVALYGTRFESLMSNLRTLMKNSMNMLAILCWQ